MVVRTWTVHSFQPPYCTSRSNLLRPLGTFTRRVTPPVRNSTFPATATGNRKLVNVTIAPQLLQENDAEALEDLVTVAVNRALEQAEKLAEAESTAMGRDMLPGFPGL